MARKLMKRSVKKESFFKILLGDFSKHLVPVYTSIGPIPACFPEANMVMDVLDIRNVGIPTIRSQMIIVVILYLLSGKKKRQRVFGEGFKKETKMLYCP
ncbi:unnamed protein product [Prunus armeniaca]